MIVDTDVLIWYFRGNHKALEEIREALPFAVSCVTFMELIQGAKNKSEQNSILKQLKAWDVYVIQISEQVSSRATQLVREHSLERGITIADALIAATALDREEPLFTGNTKHFTFIPRLTIKNFKP